MQNTKKLEGFSLIEILVGLIIISVALAAFAPTMNKKVRAQSTALDNKLTNKCDTWGKKDGQNICTLCQGTKFCVQCREECLVGYKLQVSNCSCVKDQNYNDGE